MYFLTVLQFDFETVPTLWYFTLFTLSILSRYDKTNDIKAFMSAILKPYISVGRTTTLQAPLSYH